MNTQTMIESFREVAVLLLPQDSPRSVVPRSQACPPKTPTVPSKKIITELLNPTKYDTTFLGANKSAKDRGKVLEATAIVSSLTPSGGNARRAVPTLGDIRNFMDDNQVTFSIDEFRPSSISKMERFKRNFAEANGGVEEVNSKNLNRYLECATIKALATLNELGDDGTINEEGVITLPNFNANMLRPIIPLWFSQNTHSDLVAFPGALSKLLRKCKGLAKQFLPAYLERDVIDSEMALLLIECCPKTSSYYYEFCFSISLLVLSGKRYGPLSRLVLSDISEIVQLSHPDKSKTLQDPHFLIVWKLTRDKKHAGYHKLPLVMVGSNVFREGILDPVYYFEQLLIHKYDLTIIRFQKVQSQNRKKTNSNKFWGFDKRFVSFKEGNSLHKLIKLLLLETNLPNPSTIKKGQPLGS